MAERLHLMKRNLTALTVIKNIADFVLCSSSAEAIFMESVLIRWVAFTVVRNARCNDMIHDID